MTSPDVEKNLPTADITVSDSESKNAWWSKISTWGVEVRGIVPVPIEERTDGKFVNIFSLWWTMSVSLLPLVFDHPSIPADFPLFPNFFLNI